MLVFYVYLGNGYYNSFMLGSSCWDRNLLHFEILLLICELYSRQVMLQLFSLKGSAGTLRWSCEGTGEYNLGILDYILYFRPTFVLIGMALI
jgi:hypothetical protein